MTRICQEVFEAALKEYQKTNLKSMQIKMPTIFCTYLQTNVNALYRSALVGDPTADYRTVRKPHLANHLESVLMSTTCFYVQKQRKKGKKDPNVR